MASIAARIIVVLDDPEGAPHVVRAAEIVHDRSIPATFSVRRTCPLELVGRHVGK